MSEGQRVQHVPYQTARALRPDRVRFEELSKRTSLQQLHHEIGPASRSGVAYVRDETEVRHRDDVRVLERGESAGLTQEARTHGRVLGELVLQHLDGHLVPELQMRRLVHPPHPALAEQRVQPVPSIQLEPDLRTRSRWHRR